jgi:Bacterial PH domain
MADEAWWGTLLQWAVPSLVMTAVMGWAGRSRFHRQSAHARRLAHPISTLVIGLVCLVLFAGPAVVSNVFPNPTVTWWTTSIFVGFTLLSVLVLSAFFLEGLEVSEDGLAFRNFVGVRRYLRWSDLRSVRYSPAMKWFRLETHAGTAARVSVMLTGLPEFARLLLHNAARGSIDSETFNVLGATAAGNPPSVWR